MFTYVNSMPYNEIRRSIKAENSKDIKERVELAREIQKKRFEGSAVLLNSQMNPKMIKEYCRLNPAASKLIEGVYDRYHLSTRSYSRILKVAKTISDLGGRDGIELTDIIEALQYKKYIYEEIL